MSDSRRPRRPRQPDKDANESERVADAVARLERAVNDLASAAGDRAADYVERATERLREDSGAGYGWAHPRYRYRYRYQYREPAWLWSDRPRSAKLYRDADKGKVLGVCAGIANYYGIETWVVRCVAVTGLIFLNWVVFVAYLVTVLILDVDPGEDASPVRAAGNTARRPRKARRERTEAPPARRLRDVGASFDEMELRLRRMEAHVTSGRYELHRQLAKLDAS